MKKSMVIFTVAVLLMLVSGCTQPGLTPPIATLGTTPPATAPQATIVSSLPAITTESTYPTASNAVSENTIRINRKGFDPASITVKAGSTVRWVNEDSTADPGLYNPTHRITLVNIKDSQTLSSGQGWSWIFSQPGTYDYSDLIHPTLKGTVIVV